MSNLSVYFTDDTAEVSRLDNPTFAEIENLIRQLDRDLKYYLEIVVGDIDDDNKLIIGGGAGNYIVNIIQSNLLLLLTNPEGDDRSGICVYVGREIEYPTSWVVSLPAVISAAKFYYDNCAANPLQTWEISEPD